MPKTVVPAQLLFAAPVQTTVSWAPPSSSWKKSWNPWVTPRAPCRSFHAMPIAITPVFAAAPQKTPQQAQNPPPQAVCARLRPRLAETGERSTFQ